MSRLTRPALWLIGLGAAAAGAVSWSRHRQVSPEPIAAAEWPPIRVPADDPEAAASPDADSPTPSAASFVNALVDTPDARSGSNDGTWQPPEADGTCPPGYPIKANDNSGIYHVPGGRFYDRTRAERCYATADAAAADGYRAAKA